jgi:hypothetical protein
MAVLFLLFGGLGDAAGAAPAAKITKVLPHRLDDAGRHTVAPSLYDRDAYQAFLRLHPDRCRGVRFDVHWKARGADPARLRLRVEIRAAREAKTIVLEQPVRPRRWYQRPTGLMLEGEAYRRAGEVVAWRASLWEGDQLLAEQRSFLW